MEFIPQPADEIKTDVEYREAAEKALADIEAIGERLEVFTDDYDFRVIYNKLVTVHIFLKLKARKPEDTH